MKAPKKERKGEKKKQGARIKAQASKQPKRGGLKEGREPLNTKTFTVHMKHIN
jgi:hypothetical protein